MSATFTEVHAALAEAAKRGARWASLSMSEEIAMSATLRRIAAMVVNGVTIDDWRQLAGYADWAAKRPPEMPTLANATMHGQWVEWRGGECPVRGDVLVDVRFAAGNTHMRTAAGHWYWLWHHDTGDIVAYRISD